MFLEYKLNNGYLLSKESKFAPFLTAGIGLGRIPGKQQRRYDSALPR